MEAGHQVAAFARKPSKLGNKSERLRLVQGDVQDTEQVATAIVNADAVLSVLGPTSNKPHYGVSEGIINILTAME